MTPQPPSFFPNFLVLVVRLIPNSYVTTLLGKRDVTIFALMPVMTRLPVVFVQ